MNHVNNPGKNSELDLQYPDPPGDYFDCQTLTGTAPG